MRLDLRLQHLQLVVHELEDRQSRVNQMQRVDQVRRRVHFTAQGRSGDLCMRKRRGKESGIGAENCSWCVGKTFLTSLVRINLHSTSFYFILLYIIDNFHYSFNQNFHGKFYWTPHNDHPSQQQFYVSCATTILKHTLQPFFTLSPETKSNTTHP